MDEEDLKTPDTPGPSRPRISKSPDEEDHQGFNKKTAAKRRWSLLSEHLVKKGRLSSDDSSFTTYELYTLKQMYDKDDPNWYTLTWRDKEDWPTIDLRLIDKYRFDAMELSGFNNTGNIRIWPAEECLAYYMMENEDLCDGKRVIEIGAGMTGLAGLCCGLQNADVIITDGNEKSVENIQAIIIQNGLEGKKCQAMYHRWNEPPPPELASKQFDLVIAADCFFDPFYHEAFIDNLVTFLAPGGKALLFAPERGGSLREFIEKVFQRNIFNIDQTANICDGISERLSKITASSTSENFDADKDHQMCEQFMYHTFQIANSVKEKHSQIGFDPETLVRTAGMAQAILTQKWIPDLEALSTHCKHKQIMEADVEFLFRKRPEYLAEIIELADQKDIEADFEEVLSTHDLTIESVETPKKSIASRPFLENVYHLPGKSDFSLSSKRKLSDDAVNNTLAKVFRSEANDNEEYSVTQALNVIMLPSPQANRQDVIKKPIIVPPIRQKDSIHDNNRMNVVQKQHTKFPIPLFKKQMNTTSHKDSNDNDNDVSKTNAANTPLIKILTPIIKKPLGIITRKDSFDDDVLVPDAVQKPEGKADLTSIKKPLLPEVDKDSFEDDDDIFKPVIQNPEIAPLVSPIKESMTRKDSFDEDDSVFAPVVPNLKDKIATPVARKDSFDEQENFVPS